MCMSRMWLCFSVSYHFFSALHSGRWKGSYSWLARSEHPDRPEAKITNLRSFENSAVLVSHSPPWWMPAVERKLRICPRGWWPPTFHTPTEKAQELTMICSTNLCMFRFLDFWVKGAFRAIMGCKIYDLFAVARIATDQTDFFPPWNYEQ